MKPFWLSGGLLSSALCLCAAGCVSPGELLSTSLTNPQVPPSASAAGPADTTPKLTPLSGAKFTPADELKVTLKMGKSFDDTGNDEGAVEQYEKVLKLDPNDMAVARRLCLLYDRQRQFAKADEMYRKLDKAHPNDAELLADWGYSYYLRVGKEHYAQAETLLRRSLAINPKLARAHNDLGLVLGQLERYPEAFSEFRASGLTEAEAHCDMAFVYWWKKKDGQDMMREAKAEAKLAVDKDPSCMQARELLAQLENPHPAPSEPNDKPADRFAALRREGSKPRGASLTPELEAEMHAKAQRAAERMKQGLPPEPTADEAASQGTNLSTGNPVPQGAAPPVTPVAMTRGKVWLPVHPQTAPTTPQTSSPTTADTAASAPLPPLPKDPTWTAASDKGTPAAISFEK
jgi:tetratricopeptide (TPR) repeat protein